MKHTMRLLTALATLTATTGAAHAKPPVEGPPLDVLSPGGVPTAAFDTPVNVVLIGFDGVVDEAELRATLIDSNSLPGDTPTGQIVAAQRFDYDYTIVHAPSWFTDAFFGFLGSQATPQDPVAWFQGAPALPVSIGQFLYNYCNLSPTVDPTGVCSLDPALPRVNARQVTQNHLIDATIVEKVLAANLPVVGLDPRTPTAVFINWFGRDDYVDHVYIDPNEPDPETGFARGFSSRNALAGYGGTAVDDDETCADGLCSDHRIWFHDVSAGPFLRNGSWDVRATDVRARLMTGSGGLIGTVPNGVEDYRTHHSADYANGSAETYRPLTTVTADLGLLVSDVFLSGIVHSMPIYPAQLEFPVQPQNIEIDITRRQWSPDSSFVGMLDEPLLEEKMSKLIYDVSVDVSELDDGRDSRVGAIYDCYKTWVTEPVDLFGFEGFGDSCYGNRMGGLASADLYIYHWNKINQFLEGDGDYEVPVFHFNVDPEDFLGLAGFATHHYTLDRKQSFVFQTTTPGRDLIQGHGWLTAHEVGHHLGLSHPHNGVRCATPACTTFEAMLGADATFYSWNGGFVTGVMSYIPLNNDYSSFERDNLARYVGYVYLTQANAILEKIYEKPQKKVDRITAEIVSADAQAAAGIALAYSHRPEAAATALRGALDTLVSAAESINVKLDVRNWTAQVRTPPNHHQPYVAAVRDLLTNVEGAGHPSVQSLAGSALMSGMVWNAVDDIGVLALPTVLDVMLQ